MVDERGNPIAEVIGGPDDGDTFFCREYEHGGTFVPARTASHRPIYRFEKCPNGRDRFVFVGFEQPEKGGE
jgi:hypothetical protein